MVKNNRRTNSYVNILRLFIWHITHSHPYKLILQDNSKINCVTVNCSASDVSQFVEITSFQDWQLLVYRYVVSWKTRCHLQTAQRLESNTFILAIVSHASVVSIYDTSYKSTNSQLQRNTHRLKWTKATLSHSRGYTSLYMLFEPSKELGE